MAVSDILTSIDHEIAQLQKARILLVGASSAPVKRKVGRPRKVAAAIVPTVAKPAKKKRKRNLSPEGRKRIADAVKRRWAAQKKAAAAAQK